MKRISVSIFEPTAVAFLFTHRTLCALRSINKRIENRTEVIITATHALKNPPTRQENVYSTQPKFYKILIVKIFNLK